MKAKPRAMFCLSTAIVLLLFHAAHPTFAGQIGSLTVIDKAGKHHLLTPWAVYSSGSILQTGIDDLPGGRESLTFSAFSNEQETRIEASANAAGKKHGVRNIEVVVPFAQILSICIIAPKKGMSLGQAEVTMVDGAKEQINICHLSVNGTENLGELGSSAYSANSDKIQEIRFPRMSAVQHAWGKPSPATVTDRAGKRFHVKNLKAYELRSKCTYAMHFPATAARRVIFATSYDSGRMRMR